MTDKLRDAAQQTERAAFEAWWNDPASADNSKVYEVTPTAEIRRLCQDIAERSWQARAALDRQDAQAVPQGWKPIETAPRDGTNVLLRWGVDGVSQGHYIPGLPHPWKFIDTNDGLTWLINHAVDGPGGPSHWMPMPDADVATAPMKAADEFELRRLLEEERETTRQLIRALAEATEGPTFMGEPMLNAAPTPPAQASEPSPTACAVCGVTNEKHATYPIYSDHPFTTVQINAAPTPPAQRVMPTDLEIDLLRLKSRDTFDFACTLIEAYERKNAQPKTLPTPPAQQGEEFWPEPLSEFKEGQWWVAELDAIARSVNATDEQKRAVSVVHHLLASAAKAVAKPPAQRVMLTDEEIEETMRDYVNVENGLFKVHKALIEAYEKKNGIK